MGLEDSSLLEQLEAIKFKNNKLTELNSDLIKKDDTIYSLRGKILELNNILNLSEEKQVGQKKQIKVLNQSLSTLESLKSLEMEESVKSIAEIKFKSEKTLKQVTFLSDKIDILKKEINILNKALETSEESLLTKELKIEVLGERLNKALTSKVFELQKYRSEFFGKIKSILGERKDIKILLIGSGQLKSSLIDRVNKEKLENVVFHDPVNKKLLSGLISSSNIGLQTLTNVPAFYYGTSPNKFFDYIAGGLPVINNYPGWIADIIKETNSGYVVPPEKPEVFADILEEAADNCGDLIIKSKNAKKLAINRFNRKNQSLNWVMVLEKTYNKTNDESYLNE